MADSLNPNSGPFQNNRSSPLRRLGQLQRLILLLAARDDQLLQRDVRERIRKALCAHVAGGDIRQRCQRHEYSRSHNGDCGIGRTFGSRRDEGRGWSRGSAGRAALAESDLRGVDRAEAEEGCGEGGERSGSVWWAVGV